MNNPWSLTVGDPQDPMAQYSNAMQYERAAQLRTLSPRNGQLASQAREQRDRQSVSRSVQHETATSQHVDSATTEREHAERVRAITESGLETAKIRKSKPRPTKGEYDESLYTLERARGVPRNPDLNYLHEAPRPVKPGRALPRRANGAEVRTKNSRMVDAIIAAQLAKSDQVHAQHRAVACMDERQQVSKSPLPGANGTVSHASAPAAVQAARGKALDGKLCAPRSNNLSLGGMKIVYDGVFPRDGLAPEQRQARRAKAAEAAKAVSGHCGIGTFTLAVSEMQGLEDETGTTNAPDAVVRSLAQLTRNHRDERQESSSAEVVAAASTHRHRIRAHPPQELQTFAMRTKQAHDFLHSEADSAIHRNGGLDAASRRRLLQRKLEEQQQKAANRRRKREAMQQVRREYLEAGPTQANQLDFERTEKLKERRALGAEQAIGARDFASRGLRFMLYNFFVAGISAVHYELLITNHLSKPADHNATNPFLTEFDEFGPWLFGTYMVQLVGAALGVIGVAVQYVQYMQYLRGCCESRRQRHSRLDEPQYIQLKAKLFTIVCMYLAFTMQLFGLNGHIAILIGSFMNEMAYLVGTIDEGLQAYRIFGLLVHFALPMIVVLVLLEGKMLTHRIFPLMFGKAYAIRTILQTQMCMLAFNAMWLVCLFGWFQLQLINGWPELPYFSQISTSDLQWLLYRYSLSVVQGLTMLMLAGANVFVIITHRSYDKAAASQAEGVESIRAATRVAIYNGNHARVVHSIFSPKYEGRRVVIVAELVECKANLENMALVPVRVTDADGKMVNHMIFEECQLRPDQPEGAEGSSLKEQAELRVLQVNQNVYVLRKRLELLVKLSNLFMFFLTAFSIALLVLNVVDRDFLNSSLFALIWFAIVPPCTDEQDAFKIECLETSYYSTFIKPPPITTPEHRMQVQKDTCRFWSQCIVQSYSDQAPGAFCGDCKILSSNLNVAGYHSEMNADFFFNTANPHFAIILYSSIGAGIGLVLGSIWARCFGLRGLGSITFVFVAAVMFGAVGIGFAPFASVVEPRGVVLDSSGARVTVEPDSHICGANDRVNGPIGGVDFTGISNLCLLEIGKSQIQTIDFVWGTLLTFGLTLNTLFLMFDMESTQEHITLEAAGTNAWATQLAQLYVFISCVIWVPFRIFAIIFQYEIASSSFRGYSLDELYGWATEISAFTQQVSDYWYGNSFFPWEDQRAALKATVEMRDDLGYMIYGFSQITFTFLACFIGWLLMHSAPRDKDGLKDPDSRLNQLGVRIVAVFGYSCSALPDSGLVFTQLWAVDLTINVFGLILLIKIIVGAFFIKACLQSDILPLWMWAPAHKNLKYLFYTFALLIPYISIILLTISWTAVGYAVDTVEISAQISLADAIKKLKYYYNVTYTGDLDVLGAYNITYDPPGTSYTDVYQWIDPVWTTSFVICLLYLLLAIAWLVMYCRDTSLAIMTWARQVLVPQVVQLLHGWCPCLSSIGDLDDDDNVSSTRVQVRAVRLNEAADEHGGTAQAKINAIGDVEKG